MRKTVLGTSYRNFVLKSTNSLGKFSSMDFLIAHSSVMPLAHNKFIVILVGSFRLLPRHIRECAQLGYAEHQIIAIEREERTFKGLDKYAKTMKFKGLVLWGDFIELTQHLIDEGFEIGCLSFDSVILPEEYTIRLSKFAVKQQIKEVHFVHSTRGSISEYTKKWALKNGIKPVWSPNNKKKCWPVRDISHLMVAKNMPKYSVETLGYKGISPMAATSSVLR